MHGKNEAEMDEMDEMDESCKNQQKWAKLLTIFFLAIWAEKMMSASLSITGVCRILSSRLDPRSRCLKHQTELNRL